MAFRRFLQILLNLVPIVHLNFYKLHQSSVIFLTIFCTLTAIRKICDNLFSIEKYIMILNNTNLPTGPTNFCTFCPTYRAKISRIF